MNNETHMSPTVFLRNKAACLYALSFIVDGDDEEERGVFRYLRLSSTMEALFHEHSQSIEAVFHPTYNLVPYLEASHFDYYYW